MAGAAEEVVRTPPGGLLSRRNLMLGGGALLILGGLGYGATALLASGETSEGPAAEVAEAVAPAFYMNLPEMTVNLSTVETRASYVQLSVSLQVPEEAMIEAITPHLPRVLDAFQVYLRELRLSDLQGSAGIFRLKEELQRRVNLAVYPARVDDVLFRNIVVQ